MKSVSQSLLEELTCRLAAEFALDQVWLFGSHAWGEPDEGSDLDLLVVVRESNELPIRRAQRAHRCLRGLGIAKDVLVKTRAEVERFRASARLSKRRFSNTVALSMDEAKSELVCAWLILDHLDQKARPRPPPKPSELNVR